MEQLPSFYLQASPEDKDMVSGRFPPQRIRSEDPDSVNLLIRSEDRSFGSDFDFQVDLLTTSSHIRKIQLCKAILPLLPQINVHNNTITVTHTDGTVTFTLDESYYSVQSMVNMMQAKFTAAWVSLDATNSVTISYNIERRSITIVDDNAEQFYIHNNSPFVLYGNNVVQFPIQAAGSALSTTSIESTSLEMIYSRYVTINPNRLPEDQKAYSIVSHRGPQNIVAVVDLVAAYTSQQFSVSSSYPGTQFSIETLQYAPRINLLNRTKALKVIDFVVEDEYGFKLSDLDTPTYTFAYGIVMWFQCSL